MEGREGALRGWGRVGVRSVQEAVCAVRTSSRAASVHKATTAGLGRFGACSLGAGGASG